VKRRILESVSRNTLDPVVTLVANFDYDFFSSRYGGTVYEYWTTLSLRNIDMTYWIVNTVYPLFISFLSSVLWQN